MNHSKLEPIIGDYPIHNTLCVFKCTDGSFFVGYMNWHSRAQPIKMFSKDVFYFVSDIESYQYVLNENGGFINVNKND